MADVMIFHYRDDDNFLTRLNPLAKLIAVISYSVLIPSMPPVPGIIMIIPLLICAYAVKLPLVRYMKGSIFFILLAILMAVSSYLNRHDSIASIAYGVRFLSIILASMLLVDSTVPEELARSLGSALSHIAGKRAYTAAMLVEITIAMIPIIIDSTSGILEARKARLASFGKHPVGSLAEFSQSVFSSLLDKAAIYTDAIYARGYDGTGCIDIPEYRRRDAAIITVCIICLILMMAEEILWK